MSTKAYQTFSTRKTPQSKPIPGRQDMVQNNAGGYVFPVDDWKRLERFLVLGSDAPTYYVKAPELTRRNAEAVLRCINQDGIQTVNCIVEISNAGRAPKNDPALFALAMCIKLGDLDTRRAAALALPKVARIGTHLFRFVQFMEQFGGWSKLTRQAIASWYNDMDASKLAYQVVKYQQRDGWSHQDLLRLAHPKPVDQKHDFIYGWVTKGNEVKGYKPDSADPFRPIYGFERAKCADTAGEIIALIRDYGLTREMIPTQWLNEVTVWDALLQKMPMTAMIRNLGKMTNVGLLKPMSNAVNMVCERLRNQERIKKARVHPLSVLVALKIYEQGHGVRGKLKWNPVAQIVDALDDAFYLAFGNVESTGKRTLLALDVSGSMNWNNIAGLPITPREASGAMVMVTARTEPNHYIMAFSDKLVQTSLSPRQRLDDVIKQLSAIPMGGTNCALPMLAANQSNVPVDTFIIYTDNETWFGDVHPCQALQEYRQKMGIGAKLITVGMTSSGFTIADPNDAGMLDCVGFDTATPQVISDFTK